MFDPNANKAEKALKAKRKKACQQVSAWSMELVPVALRDGLMLDVKDVVCGDPSCAPVDTVFTLVWSEGGRGVFALPYSPEELDADEMQEVFPDEETLTAWKAGKRASWPPKPPLRFDVGDRVECRVGPHPTKGWAPGRIIRLHYSEPNWPPNMLAPYQVALHDGRLIFAPQDSDLVIRSRPPPAPDAPSSPELPSSLLDNMGDDEEDYDEEEEEDYDEEGKHVFDTIAKDNES